jgi:DNA-binding MarR family transcriptional regulator
VKDREYQLLDAISKDSTVTQANLASSLEMAVGSVNWYIKRLISRGYLKASRMDRTRLRYNLTPEGMAALTQRATQYAISSLQIYRDLREAAKTMIADLLARGIHSVFLQGNNEFMDIFRLSCIEAGIRFDPEATAWVVTNAGSNYILEDIRDTVTTAL